MRVLIFLASLIVFVQSTFATAGVTRVKDNHWNARQTFKHSVILQKVLKLISGSATGTTTIILQNADQIYHLELDGDDNDGYKIRDVTDSVDLLHITTTGLMGLGNITPLEDLHLSSTTPAIRLTDTGGGYTDLDASSGVFVVEVDDAASVADSYFAVKLDGTEHARIATTGFGIATTSPAANLHVASISGNVNMFLEANGTSDDSSINFHDGAVAGGITYDHGSNSLCLITAAAPSEANGDMCVDASGNVGVGVSSTSAEMEINGGNGDTQLIIGTTGASGNNQFITFEDASENVFWSMGAMDVSNLFKLSTSAHPNTTAVLVINNSGQMSVGSGASPSYNIEATDGAVAGAGAYVDTSDKRLKKDFEPVSGACETLGKLSPQMYNWRTSFYRSQEKYAKAVRFYDTDESGHKTQKQGLVESDKYQKVNQPHGKKDIGFLAQEVKPVFPQAVRGSNSAGYTVAYSKFVPLLVACVQEQQNQIKSLLGR